MCCDPFSQSQEHKHSASLALQRWLSCADVWRGSVIDVNHAGHSARAFHPDAHRWLATVTWIQPKGMLRVTLADGQSQSRISCLKAILTHLFTHSFSVTPSFSPLSSIFLSLCLVIYLKDFRKGVFYACVYLVQLLFNLLKFIFTFKNDFAACSIN